MSTALDDVLDHLGYTHRPQQDRLYDALLANDERLVAQAGTGTGKSIAVLAAAAEKAHITGFPSLIVVPMNTLLNQYVDKDAPAVEEALGVTIRALKGRSHYLCASSQGMKNQGDDEPWLRGHLLDDEPFEVDPYYGCPGSNGCRYDPEDPADMPCHYRLAKERLQDADVVITNAHLLIIDHQLRAGEVAQVLPDYGALFIDEAHALEEVARGFTESSINAKTLSTMGEAGWPLITELERMAMIARDSTEVKPAQIANLVPALNALAHWTPPEGTRGSDRQWDARNAANTILQDGQDGVFERRQRVLWFDPPKHPKHARLAGTQINLAGLLGAILGRVPTALVSATIPRTLPEACGISGAQLVDVGHPFDYRRQAWLGFSRHSGGFREADQTRPERARELLELVDAVDGGVLLLFSAFKDLSYVNRQIGREILRRGRPLMVQEDGVDKVDMARRFREAGNAVLFGSASFATGLDVPGNALQGVGIWKLPYPGLDPVTRAISDLSRARYEDMMRTAVAQAIGRLIRTIDDRGVIWVADSRGVDALIRRSDPMTAHLHEFSVLAKPSDARGLLVRSGQAAKSLLGAST